MDHQDTSLAETSVPGGAQSAYRAHLDVWSRLAAAQQPSWEYAPELGQARAELGVKPALVEEPDVLALRGLLARVEAGDAHLLHVGECAELFEMAEPVYVGERLRLYQRMADRLAERTGKEAVLLARMAGQHAKPRSSPTEVLPSGEELAIYRGDAVNRRTPEADARKPDPWRLLESYHASAETLELIRREPQGNHRVFVSHEALLRDYEEPMTRGRDTLYATTGHLVWIGERTRRLWNWHIQWARSLANPVGVKFGPSATPYDIFDVVRTLNPESESGRLSVILRMGAEGAADRIAPAIKAVTEASSPVLWQCDPMHGNTRKLGDSKFRLLPDLRSEVTTFVRSLRRAGHHPGGLHLEVTPYDVFECHESVATAADGHPAPPCDPRLNAEQAMEMVDHFAAEVAS
ncbi:3-deoxy-7-phosphoheptulonate synthase [Streptomyces sp. 184]|uniref:3-deoxy-7-phosphoheptulonate synthase n=1 Tax=Streptomyces sp. 184 TaxID=1827526 RepID=UPI003891A1F3